jgi:hypothetical protein
MPLNPLGAACNAAMLRGTDNLVCRLPADPRRLRRERGVHEVDRAYRSEPATKVAAAALLGDGALAVSSTARVLVWWACNQGRVPGGWCQAHRL